MRMREIPIQIFGLRLKLAIHLTTGSFINKDIIVGPEYVSDSRRFTQSVTDFYTAEDLEVTPFGLHWIVFRFVAYFCMVEGTVSSERSWGHQKYAFIIN